MEIDNSSMSPDEFVKIRNQLGWSQKHMAEILGVHLQTIWRYENAARKIPSPLAALLRNMAENKGE